MGKKTDGFDEISLHKAAKMAKSEAGQQLLGLLQSQHGDQLQAAMQQASAGNFAQVKEMMEQMMSSEEAQQLLKKLQE
ncbi:MAG: hypothetical protein IJO72_01610 [Oscillospiraceae bacterium]|nr:hypothetical protein [Oscillospiraceae bacterium]MBQ9929470.1 hypothetical protein [Oscillospiraceae bacterium]